MSKKVTWEYNTGKVHRKFTEEWSNSGFINMDKIPDLVGSLVTERKNMVEYIEALHNKIDHIMQKNAICPNSDCHTAGCTSDHK